MRVDRGSQFIRQWKLLALLSARRFGCTLAEMAEDLSYHPRTIRRDLGVLESAGFLLERDRRPGNREVVFKLPSAYRAPNIPFNLAELMAVYFSSNLLKGLRGSPFKEGIESAVGKIEKTLPIQVLDYLFTGRNALLAKALSHKDYRPHAETLEILQRAVAERRKVDLVYQAYGRSKPDRHVFQPWCMTFAEGSFYLIGYSEPRKARRIFLLDRVRRASLLDAKFEVPEDFDPDAFLEEGFGIYHEDKIYDVKIEFAKGEAQFIRERVWHPTQKILSLKDGRVVLSMKVAGLMDVVRWVLSYGDGAKALEPPELVDQVRRQLRQGAALYR